MIISLKAWSSAARVRAFAERSSCLKMTNTIQSARDLGNRAAKTQASLPPLQLLLAPHERDEPVSYPLTRSRQPKVAESESPEDRTRTHRYLLTLPTTLSVAIKPSILIPPINEMFFDCQENRWLDCVRLWGHDHRDGSIPDASRFHPRTRLLRGSTVKVQSRLRKAQVFDPLRLLLRGD